MNRRVVDDDIWYATHTLSCTPHLGDVKPFAKQLFFIFLCALVFFVFFFLVRFIVGIIYLRSHLGKYLSVNSYGNVLCETDERDGGSRFQISIAEDGSGRWALRNESRGYFLGGTPDELKCTAKVPSNTEFWTVHLAARPQVRLFYR